MSKLKDTSIFANIVQFDAPNGKSYRAEKQGGGVIGISESRGDGFVRIMTTRIKGEPTPDKIYAQILNDD